MVSWGGLGGLAPPGISVTRALPPGGSGGLRPPGISDNYPCLASAAAVPCPRALPPIFFVRICSSEFFREDGSDFDDFWTVWIAPTPAKIWKNFERTKNYRIDRIDRLDRAIARSIGSIDGRRGLWRSRRGIGRRSKACQPKDSKLRRLQWLMELRNSLLTEVLY